MQARIDRAYRRYQRTGDAQALTRVFDATAPELYRLAFHLVGDRHAAEDLVQATFLAAIQDAASFDGERRVLPWLLGILANRARHDRRQARQRERAPRTALASPAGDPVALAAAGELNATVAAAVRRLPDPYRQVVLLHVLHELSPKEVAEALARPDATVRTQLHRGLDLLRKLLPASLVGVAPGCAPPPLGLGTVRAVVLAAAARHGAVAAGAGAATGTFGGVLAMKKVLSLIGAVLAFVLAWSLWPQSQPLPRAEAPPLRVAASATATGDAVAAETVSPPSVREVVTPLAADARAALDVLVRWTDGTPAADVSVRCKPVRSDGELWLRVAHTDDAGLAHFDDLWPGKAAAAVDRGGKAEVELSAGATQQLTLDIPRGIDVRGRVLDPDDRPIAGAIVWLSVVPNSDDSEPVATAGPDGAFTVRSAGPDHILSAAAPGYGCARVVHVTEQRAGEERILRLRRVPGVLVGTVLDDSGRPIADARVLVGVTMVDGEGTNRRILGEIVGKDFWPSRFLRTDAVGMFHAEGLPPLPWPVWVGAPGHAPAFEVVEVGAESETNVTLRMQTGGRIRGCVTDPADAPVADAGIHARYVAEAALHEQIGLGIGNILGPPQWAMHSTRTDAQGNYVLDHVMAGKLGIGASTRSDFAHGELEVQNGADAEWNPRFALRLLLFGIVVDETGQPLADWNVRCVSDARDGRRNARSDARGGFRIESIVDGDYQLSVQANDPAVGPVVAIGTFRPGPDPIRIVVPRDAIPTGSLRGTVLGPDGGPCTSGFVRLTHLATSQPGHAVLDAEGHYQSSLLRRGRYRVQFESGALGSHLLGECEVGDGGDAELGVFHVPPPGRLEVTVVDADGRVMPEAWLDAHAEGGSQAPARLTHREGHVYGSLGPGHYHVATRAPLPFATQQVDVRSGETTVVRFLVPNGVPFVLRVPAAAREQGELRQTWRDAQGALLRDAAIESSDAGKDLEWRAPPGRYTLEVRSADGRKAATAVVVRAMDPPLVVELPLPAAK